MFFLHPARQLTCFRHSHPLDVACLVARRFNTLRFGKTSPLAWAPNEPDAVGLPVFDGRGEYRFQTNCT